MISEVFSSLTDSVIPGLCRQCQQDHVSLVSIFFCAGLRPCPCEQRPALSPCAALGLGREGWLRVGREGKENGKKRLGSWRTARGSSLAGLWAAIILAAAPVTAWAVLVCVRLFLVSQAAAPSESELRGGNLILCVGGEPIPECFWDGRCPFFFSVNPKGCSAVGDAVRGMFRSWYPSGIRGVRRSRESREMLRLWRAASRAAKPCFSQLS